MIENKHTMVQHELILLIVNSGPTKVSRVGTWQEQLTENGVGAMSHVIRQVQI